VGERRPGGRRFPGYFFPDLYLESAEAMRDQYHREIEQLASDYGKLDLVWFDGGGEQWLGFGGLEFASAPADWRTREGADRLGEFDNVQPWELCVTLAGAWGYQPGAQPRSLRELVLLLTNTAVRDGRVELRGTALGDPTVIVELTYEGSVMGLPIDPCAGGRCVRDESAARWRPAWHCSRRSGGGRARWRPSSIRISRSPPIRAQADAFAPAVV